MGKPSLVKRIRWATWRIRRGLVVWLVERLYGEDMLWDADDRERLRSALEPLERHVALKAFDQHVPHGWAKSPELSELLDRAREALTSTSASPVGAVVEAARKWVASRLAYIKGTGTAVSMRCAERDLTNAVDALDTGTGATQEGK